jgi:hypothetical protein
MWWFVTSRGMANRQTGNKSRARKTDQPLQQNVEQNQLGLKEAYAILQQGERGGSFIVNTC